MLSFVLVSTFEISFCLSHSLDKTEFQFSILLDIVNKVEKHFVLIFWRSGGISTRLFMKRVSITI